MSSGSGITLESLLRRAREPLALERVAEITVQACAGLEAAHANAIVHGHLTPGSLLITDQGTVKITDFGLTGGFVTPYSSPEQISEEMLTPASDIFSLAVILYEALTLRNPFAGPGLDAIASAIISYLPPLASEINPAIPETLARVLEKAMTKEPAFRFSSAHEFGDAVQATMRDAPAHALLLRAREEGERIEREIRYREIEQRLNQAKSEMRRQEFLNALERLERALAIDPQNTEALALQAEIERERAEAIRGEKRLKLSDSLLAQAREFEARGQFSEALDRIETLRRMNPGYPGIDLFAEDMIRRNLEQMRSASFDREIRSPPSAPAPAAADPQSPSWIQLPRSAPAPTPAPVLDYVHFTITAPSRLEPGSSFELYFWVHLDKQRQGVLQRAMHSLGIGQTEDMVVKSEGPVTLPRGTVVSARISIEGLTVNPGEKRVVWSGEAGCATFVIDVPPGAAQKQYHGVVSIRVNSCEVARMDFLLQMVRESDRVPAKLKRHSTAFASYASEDRDAVLARVQGMHKVAPWLNVFMDAIDLRSGESWENSLREAIRASDIFYLFWCRHARASEWVEREWRYAFEQRGLGFIDPVPLEPPQSAPPPDELKARHFNDLWTQLNADPHGP